MTSATDHPSNQRAMNPLAKAFSLVYGMLAYAVFLGTILYAIGFVGGFIVPKAIDSGDTPPTTSALMTDIVLLGIFAVQHSGMARRAFKSWLTKVVSPVIERSTYVLTASSLLILLFIYWQPLPTIVWEVSNPTAATAIRVLSLLGWAIVFYSTFLISHFELFGLKQVVLNFVGRAISPISFRTPALYRIVRHPLYLGFIIAFWSTAVMTLGHLVFAIATTAYILIAIVLEERDLVAMFGDEYLRYRARVSKLLPGIF